MDVNEQVLRERVWSIPSGDKVEHDPIVIRSWMAHTVQHVISVMRDEDLLEVRHATIEWNSGAAVVTSNVLSSVPMGTLAYIADEWREDVGA